MSGDWVSGGADLNSSRSKAQVLARWPSASGLPPELLAFPHLVGGGPSGATQNRFDGGNVSLRIACVEGADL